MIAKNSTHHKACMPNETMLFQLTHADQHAILWAVDCPRSESAMRLLLGCLLMPVLAAAPATAPPTPRYAVRVESNVRVAMRDGVKLATDLYFPEGTGGKLPGILVRTPYDRKKQSATGKLFAGQGYLVAIQDVRGKFDSGGTFILSAADTN